VAGVSRAPRRCGAKRLAIISTSRKHLKTNNGDFDEEKIEALTEMICRAGDDPGTKAAALLVLMATVENSSHPKALANAAKHLAFTRCGELNVYSMVDAQIAVAESELLAGNTLMY